MTSSPSPEHSTSPSLQNDPTHEQEETSPKLKGKEPEEPTDNTQNESDNEDEHDGDSSTGEPQSGETSTRGQSQVPTAGDWQAIWSPAHNAYYFYNAQTQETTWTNPLRTSAAPSAASAASTSTSPEPSTSAIPATPASLASLYQLQEAAAAQGIDPSLAHLDPTLIAGPSSSGAGFEHAAKFNARTGAFTKADARDPTHLSEYERAKRMSQFYFDVNAWEAEVAERKQQEEAEGKKRKRPSKKDLVRMHGIYRKRPIFIELYPSGEIQGAKATEKDR